MLKPFVTYVDFTMEQVTEIQGDVRLSQVKVEYHSQAWNEELGMFVPTVSLEDRIKVTLYPTEAGSKIAFMSQGHNGEGRNTRYESIEQGVDEWLVAEGSYGRDCDGRYSSHFDGVSDGNPDTDYNNKYFPTMGDMSLVREAGSEARDYTAEAAGY